MITPILTTEQYATERAICDRAQAYADSIMRPAGAKPRNYMTAEEALHPDYAACDNDMRGRVSQYETLTSPPDRLVAYMGQPDRQACNYESAQPWPVTTWAGNRIGTATISAKWRVRSFMGSHMFQFYARIADREYTGRGFGEGMCVSLRETAASKRKRGA